MQDHPVSRCISAQLRQYSLEPILMIGIVSATGLTHAQKFESNKPIESLFVEMIDNLRTYEEKPIKKRRRKRRHRRPGIRVYKPSVI